MATRPGTTVSERLRTKFKEVNARLVSRLKDEGRYLYDIGTRTSRPPSTRRRRTRALKRVARFPRDAVEHFGWSKLDLVGRLWELLPGEDDFENVEGYRFRVPSPDGTTTRTLDRMSKRDLLAAIDLASDDVELPRVPPAVRRLVSSPERSLAGVPGVRLPSSGTALAPRLTILGLPCSAVTTLRDALDDALSSVPARTTTSLLQRELRPPMGVRRPLVVRPMRTGR